MPVPSVKDPIQRMTARERVYETLQQWIIDGTLVPEERLNDVELSKYFSVSRTPVREALQMLAEQKLVTMVPSSGTFVAPIDHSDMVHVYELLAELQAYAITAGISNASPQTLDTLHRINESFFGYAMSGDAANSIVCDRDFHNTIAALPGNPYLVSFTEKLMIQAHRNEYSFFRDCVHPQQSYDAHNRIIQAVSEGNAAEASESIRENWRISISRRDN